MSHYNLGLSCRLFIESLDLNFAADESESEHSFGSKSDSDLSIDQSSDGGPNAI